MLLVNEVSKRFSGIVALDNVTLKMNSQELLGIVGPNGSGKTTLLNAISGHVKLDAGKIIFKGEDITKLPIHKRIKLGIARSFQQTKIFKNLRVRENLKIATEDESIIEEVLKLLGLKSKADSLAAMLTLFEMKKLELARCLALKPSLILLDEPMAGLLSSEANEMGELIKNLSKENGFSFIIVEHKLSNLFKIVDRVVVMNAGKVVADQEPEKVLENPLFKEVFLSKS